MKLIKIFSISLGKNTDMKKISANLSRRSFLQRTAVATASAFAMPMILPSSVLGREGAVAPNSRINIAMIGTGRQVFYANLPWFLWSKDCQVVALCDVDSWRMEEARKRVEENYANDKTSGVYQGCAMYRDFREVLDRKDVDAVMITTPDHWHASMAVAAAKAGKDIALEKPVSLTVAQGRAITEAVKKSGRILRTDTEVRFDKRFHRLCEVVRNGRIGKVKRVFAGVPKNPPPLEKYPAPLPVPPELDYELWQGPAPERPYTEQRVHYRHTGLDYTKGTGPGWFNISDYSQGNMLNWCGHIIDIVQWALDTERTGPVEVEGHAEFPQDNLWDVPQQQKVRYRYASGIELFYAEDRPFVRVEGDDGWIENTWFKDDGFKASSSELLKWNAGPNEIQLPRLSEKDDFINCVKSRKEPIIPAEIGHRDATIAQIGFIASKLGRKLQWDPVAEKFIGNEAANRMLSRPMRGPWAV